MGNIDIHIERDGNEKARGREAELTQADKSTRDKRQTVSQIESKRA